MFIGVVSGAAGGLICCFFLDYTTLTDRAHAKSDQKLSSKPTLKFIPRSENYLQTVCKFCELSASKSGYESSF